MYKCLYRIPKDLNNRFWAICVVLWVALVAFLMVLGGAGGPGIGEGRPGGGLAGGGLYSSF